MFLTVTMVRFSEVADLGNPARHIPMLLNPDHVVSISPWKPNENFEGSMILLSNSKEYLLVKESFKYFRMAL